MQIKVIPRVKKFFPYIITIMELITEHLIL